MLKKQVMFHSTSRLNQLCYFGYKKQRIYKYHSSSEGFAKAICHTNMKNCYKAIWIYQVVGIQVTAIISPFPCWLVVKTEIQFSIILCSTVRFL